MYFTTICVYLFPVGFIFRIPKKFWKKYQENYLFLHRLYREVRKTFFYLFFYSVECMAFRAEKSTVHSYCTASCAQLHVLHSFLCTATAQLSVHSYCTAFCAQLLHSFLCIPSLAGSGNNAGHNGGKNGRLIKTYARML